MPVIHIILPRFRSSTPSLMVQKTNESTNDPKSTPSTQTSIFVFISARAIASLGFALSLLAIWFGWLLPAFLTAPAPSDTSEIKKTRPVPRHHRRSVSSSTRTTPVSPPVRRASAPVDLAPILVPHPEENIHDSSRRVYFADLPSASVSRRNTMPVPAKPNNFPIASNPTILLHSSSPSPSRPETPPNGFLDDLNAHDSDSSISKPSRLQKLKLGLNLKSNRHPPVDKQSDRDSITSIESTASEKAARRTSASFVAAWSSSRARTAGDDIDPGLTSPSRFSFVRLLSPSTPATAAFTPSSPGPMDSPTFSSRKTDRRRSTPIPRTYPYGAPYFASPPVLLNKDTYPSYLKTLPQFEDEIQFSSARAFERGRESTIQRVSLNPSRRSVPKRRSASEDWTVRPQIDSQL